MGAKPPLRLKALLSSQSYYSFGFGVSSPQSLAKRAAELGYRYLAITDELNVTAGVELFQAAREYRIRALLGARVPVVVEGKAYPLTLLVSSRTGYANLNRIISQALERESRDVPLPLLLAETRDLVLLTGDREGPVARLLAERRLALLEEVTRQLKGAFPQRLFVQLYHDNYRWDSRRARVIRRFAHSCGLPVVTAPPVRYARAEQYRLHDALICGRLGVSVATPSPLRPQNDCHRLSGPEEYARRLPFTEGIENANRLADELYFELLPERLAPPRAQIPSGADPNRHLAERCFAELLRSYGGSQLEPARQKLLEELATIRALGLADFFLVAAEVTDYCRRHGILAAGRGSAAASICCYLLGITQTDPVRFGLLFERFLHTGKASMPDVDIDIGSARRDEVLAWIEERFGASSEAMVCNKITYKLPLAIQDLGRALGIPPQLRDELTRSLGRDYRGLRPPQVERARAVFDEVLGDCPANEALRSLLALMEPKQPRHLSPHSGGMVLSAEPLLHYSPLERSSGGIKIIQLDKEDAEALGLIKLDLLGLRMLSALERAREEVFRLEGSWLDLAELPDEPAVWELIGRGDTLGLFQVESPSQQQTSRVMRVRSLRDLAHQIALIRPGPIQSGSVHPYLRRRRGVEPVSYLHPSLEPILDQTYGVLLFQEDVLRICVHFAGMDWVEADRFRKRVSGWTGLEEIEPDRQRFIAGAKEQVGASEEEASAVFEAIKAFQGFGFAESHAWAFALHTYASGWLRVHYPAEYLAAIMTERPGMWSQSTKRQEARSWGVGFLPLSVNASGVHYRCEWAAGEKLIRPPLSEIKGVGAEAARAIVIERLCRGRFASVEAFHSRLALPAEAAPALARAGAFDSLLPRREALYRLAALGQAAPAGANTLLDGSPPTPPLAPLSRREELIWDYRSYGFSTQAVHPLDLIRDRLRELAALPLAQVRRRGRKSLVRTAGLVVGRQKPATAKGFAFFVIEDGPVRAQLILSPQLWEENRVLLRDASVLVVEGTVEETASQLAIKPELVLGLPSPVSTRGYHY